MIIKTNILTFLRDGSLSYQSDCYLTIENDCLASISSECFSDSYLDYSHAVCLPGFIDLHIHLSQINVRGRQAKGLLQWLNDFIFAEEKRAKDPDYATELSSQFFHSLLSSGTTTAVVYVTPDPVACDIAFQKANEMGFRTIMGQTLMDQNCPEFLCRSTEQSLEESINLYNKWNRATPLLEYIFTPRFAPVCSSELMQGIGNFASENQAYIQTHLSENLQEISWVKELFPSSRNYTEVYQKHGLLGEKTLLGHAIHLADQEMAILAETASKITHCPDSNFFLHSGVYPVERILKHGIDFGLGSDVGAGTSLYMPDIMKMFIYRQDTYRLTPADALYYSTLGSAKVLGKEDELGSIEENKSADLIFLQIPKTIEDSAESILSYLVYLSSADDILATYIAGKECYVKQNY
jgi:guanine deaminase